MEYIDELQKLTYLLELAEQRLRRAVWAYSDSNTSRTNRNNLRIDTAMRWTDRRKRQIIELIKSHIYE
jgi:hypothetical protein